MFFQIWHLNELFPIDFSTSLICSPPLFSLKVVVLLDFLFCHSYFLKFSPKDMSLLILEREGKERGRETSMWERNIDRLPSKCTSTGHGTCNLGICPDRELNLQTCGVLDSAPAKRATPSGSHSYFRLQLLPLLLYWLFFSIKIPD